MKHTPAATAYLNSCEREGAECALELLNALNTNERECALSGRARPLTDSDVKCIADALRFPHSLRSLNLEENSFGLVGLQAILDTLAANPGIVRELRLGKNKLKDPAAVVLGNALTLSGLGLKVLDFSENGVTKLGCLSICQALSSKCCDLVEVSLHNNCLEADAAVSIAQAARASTKLKHLHLGYNALRDGGAIQVARCIPISTSLSSLDLTGNRIGPQGGQELARALMAHTCSIQRLNLRHNNLDDDTLQLFSEVILRNTSLTQLFLGFMNPSEETGMMVLTALRHNRTLLLLDLLGWKFDKNLALQIMDDIIFHNLSIRSIVSDGVEFIHSSVERGNSVREERGLHKVYIGPDDRQATQMVTVKKHPIAVRSDSQPAHRGMSPSSALSSSAPRNTISVQRGTPTPILQQPSNSTQREGRHPTSTPFVLDAGTKEEESHCSEPKPKTNTQTTLSLPQKDESSPPTSTNDYLEELIKEVQRAECDPWLRNQLTLILSQMNLKLDIQRSFNQQQVALLEDRVRSLEQQEMSRVLRDQHNQQKVVLSSQHNSRSDASPAILSNNTRVSPQSAPLVKSHSPSRHVDLSQIKLSEIQQSPPQIKGEERKSARGLQNQIQNGTDKHTPNHHRPKSLGFVITPQNSALKVQPVSTTTPSCIPQSQINNSEPLSLQKMRNPNDVTVALKRPEVPTSQSISGSFLSSIMVPTMRPTPLITRSNATQLNLPASLPASHPPGTSGPTLQPSSSQTTTATTKSDSSSYKKVQDDEALDGDRIKEITPARSSSEHPTHTYAPAREDAPANAVLQPSQQAAATAEPMAAAPVKQDKPSRKTAKT